MLTVVSLLKYMMTSLRAAPGLFLMLFCLASAAPAQTIFQPAVVSPQEFAVMAWGESPSDPQQLRWMRAAGLNISGFCRLADLDRVAAAGLACFVDDPRVKGYPWESLPPESELQKRVMPVVDAARGRAAALGFFLQDEPGVPMMAGLGEMAGLLRNVFPGKWSYVNLFPTYASSSQLGTTSYEDYVQEFLRVVHPPFLSYDNYSLLNGRMDDRFYTNLEIIRRLSLQAGIPFWNVILANTLFNEMDPSDATLDLQVYSTLAYGGRGVEYFTYFTPDVGNFRMAAIDPFGHRTATWYMLRRVNNEIRTLAPWLAGLRSTGVYHSPPLPPQSQPLSGSRWVKSVQTDDASSPGLPARFLVGEFADKNGKPFLMLVNEDLSRSLHFTIMLRKAGGKLWRISSHTGKLEPLGGEMDWLGPGAGVLLRIQ